MFSETNRPLVECYIVDTLHLLSYSLKINHFFFEKLLFILNVSL